MTAIREQIFAEIDSRLTAIAGVKEVERMPAGDPARFPALHIIDLGDKLESGEAGTSRWELSLGLDGFVSGGDGGAAHSAAHALYASVVEALFVEPVLGGLAHEITLEAAQFVVAERASKRSIAFSLDLTIHYATRRGSPQIID